MKNTRRAVHLISMIVVGIVLFVPLLFPLYWIIVSSFQNLSTIYASCFRPIYPEATTARRSARFCPISG